MAQEGSEASVASSSPALNWWEIHASQNFPSWSAMSRWQPPSQNSGHPSNSGEDDISVSAASFTNSSSEPSENHLWSQVLLGIGSGGNLHNSHDDNENFLEVLSSKTLAQEMFDPACDYLKKLDNGWELASPSSLNNLEKQLSLGYNGGLVERERLSTLSDLVSNWSIAPPDPQIDHHIAPSTCNVFVNPSMIQYSTPNIVNSHIKNELLNTQHMDCMPYVHEIKGEIQHHEMGISEPSLLRSCTTDDIGYEIGINNSIIGLNNKFRSGVTDAPWSNTRNMSDLVSFTNCLNKPSLEFRASKLYVRGSDSSNSKKLGYGTSSSTRGSGRGSGTTNEGKKKRSEDSSDVLFKKSKHESPTMSSLKLQAPKVKLGDKITALQQIVSPFGKTDTASVLLETIKYIGFLQEQVQLLSDPYMKSSANKDHNSWGALERKEKKELKVDLRSRGLCLVPISCTPQAYRESTGPDYWTPTYRGCLYR